MTMAVVHAVIMMQLGNSDDSGGRGNGVEVVTIIIDDHIGTESR